MFKVIFGVSKGHPIPETPTVTLNIVGMKNKDVVIRGTPRLFDVNISTSQIFDNQLFDKYPIIAQEYH